MSGYGAFHSTHRTCHGMIRVELEIFYTSGKVTKSQQIMAKTIPTTDMTSDALPS